MLPKLGILAGGGALPRRLIDHCRATDRAFFVVAIEGQCDASTVVDAPHVWCRLGAAGSLLAALRQAKASDIVLVGRVRRPSIGALRPDLRGIAILAQLGANFFGGDDRLLRGIAGVLERQGFRVLGVHQILSDLVAPHGVLGRVRPDAQAERDIACGTAAARDLGRRDIGQAVIVRNEAVVDREDAAGTDALIRRNAGQGGVLVKMKKPQQDMRMDLPAIGLDTVRLAAQAGLAGIAVEAGGALIVDRVDAVRAADEAGLFVMGTDGR